MMMVRKTAQEVAQSVRSAPLAMAVIIINICFVGLAGFVSWRIAIANEQQRQTIQFLIKSCLEKGEH